MSHLRSPRLGSPPPHHSNFQPHPHPNHSSTTTVCPCHPVFTPPTSRLTAFSHNTVTHTNTAPAHPLSSPPHSASVSPPYIMTFLPSHRSSTQTTWVWTPYGVIKSIHVSCGEGVIRERCIELVTCGIQATEFDSLRWERAGAARCASCCRAVRVGV